MNSKYRAARVAIIMGSDSDLPVMRAAATELEELGIDHERLTFTYAGRPYRLTDVYGKVIDPLVS